MRENSVHDSVTHLFAFCHHCLIIQLIKSTLEFLACIFLPLKFIATRNIECGTSVYSSMDTFVLLRGTEARQCEMTSEQLG